MRKPTSALAVLVLTFSHTVLALSQPIAVGGDILIWMNEEIGSVEDLSWSPDGALIAVVTEDGISALNSSSGEVVWSVKVGEPLGLDWCPLGKLGAVTASSVIILDGSGRELVEIPVKGGGEEALLEWSPDCRTLAVAISRLVPRGRESSLLLITGSGSLVSEVSLEAGASSIAWSPDGRLVAVGLDNGRLTVMSEDGSQAWTTRAGLALRYGDELSSAAWSPDSSRLVVGLASSVLVCYDSGGRELWRSNPLGTPIHSVDWSQTGLAAAGGDWVAALNSTGAVLWLKPRYGRAIREVRWSQEGDRLAVLSYRWLLILSPEGEIVLSTGLLPDSATVMEWSPNFGAVAVGGLFGVAAFVASPVHVLAPVEVTAPRGRLSLNLTLENRAPAAVEVTLTVSLDGVPVEEREIRLPPGESNVSLAMDAPPGDHLLEIECRSPGGVHATSTKVTSLEPPRLRAWALSPPGGPVRIVLAITNPNPVDVPIRVAVLDRGVEVYSEGCSLPPGPTYQNITLPLEPGVHRLRIRVLGSAGTFTAEYNLSAAVVGPSIPLRLEAPAGVKLGSAEVELSVDNPYPLPLNITLECFVDSSPALRQNVTIEEGGSRVFSIRVPTGEHAVYARALFEGTTLAESSIRVSVIPTWFLALVVGSILVLLTLTVLRRVKTREASIEKEVLAALLED